MVGASYMKAHWPFLVTVVFVCGGIFVKVEGNTARLDERTASVQTGRENTLRLDNLTEMFIQERQARRTENSEFMKEFKVFLTQQNEFLTELKLQRKDITFIQQDIGDIMETLDERYGN